MSRHARPRWMRRTPAPAAWFFERGWTINSSLRRPLPGKMRPSPSTFPSKEERSCGSKSTMAKVKGASTAALAALIGGMRASLSERWLTKSPLKEKHSKEAFQGSIARKKRLHEAKALVLFGSPELHSLGF